MDPFLSQIGIFGFNFAPRNWGVCNGDIIAISDNPSLYSLLGTAYGGDGRTTFALPELRGRTCIHQGKGYTQGAKGGEEMVLVTVNEMPAHSHYLAVASEDATQKEPQNSLLAAGEDVYSANVSSMTTLHEVTLSSTGSTQGHDNMQPYQVMNFCIALTGVFPDRN